MRHAIAVLACAIMISLAIPFAGAEEPPPVDPRADQVLKQMSDYLASLKQFDVQAETAYETLLDSGQKLMFVSRVSVSLKRPNRLFVHRRGMVRDQALDYATGELGLTAAGSDLFYSDVYGGLMADVLSGIYIGKTEINGVKCHHLAFRGAEVDWQIWIAEGAEPLPWKYVITSKWMTGAPQYTLNIRKWDTAARIPEKRFHFKAPEGTARIDFLPQA